ncbi:MAG: lysylphosphatidylglycerol synthase transmembrane domain-containing protein [Chloroflexi bacterium]|nr:lysylphosphatidylglycerol synthase transmembrane domain-containing protein [Chloroflexota bacterium]
MSATPPHPAADQPAPPRWLTPQRAILATVGLVLSGLSLWLTLRQINLDEAAVALRGAHLWFLAPAVITYFADLGFRAWRWRTLLRPVKPLPVRSVYPVTVIGYMGNMLLPARLGEVVRAVVLMRRGIGPSAALGSIATERILDGLTTIALLLVTSHFLPRPAWLTAGLTVVTVIFVGALVVLALALAFRSQVMALLTRVLGRFRWSAAPLRWIEHFLDGLAALRSPDLLLRAVAIGLIAWTCSALEYYWVFRAFDLPLGVAASYFAVAAIGLSTMIPAAPGYVGTFELAGVAVLTALGASPAGAFSAIVLMHLLQVVPVTVVGLIFAWREGLTVASLRGRA